MAAGGHWRLRAGSALWAMTTGGRGGFPLRPPLASVFGSAEALTRWRIAPTENDRHASSVLAYR
jgi:hypothetical protein